MTQQGKGLYKQAFDTSFTDDEVKQGKRVKVFKMPTDTYFKRFRTGSPAKLYRCC